MYRFFLFCFVFLAPAFSGIPAKADPVQDANAAAARQDYDGAGSILRRAAVAGDVSSQSHLGSVLYFGGWGKKPDREEGLRWLRAAANRNDVKAQLILAREATDRAEALNWYEKAALNGSAEAQAEIGKAYWDGDGRARDIKAAVQWYQKAAAAGQAVPQLVLGVQYALGNVVPRDFAQSRYWLSKVAGSSKLGSMEAENYLGTLYEKGLGGQQNYGEALRLYEEAAKGYSPYAEFEIGTMHEFGRGVPINLEKALDFYEKAALKRYGPAQYRMGIAYLRGDGVSRDRAQALKWLALALGWNGIDNLARAKSESAPPQHENVRFVFARDPDLFRLLTGQLRPDAYDYAIATVRELVNDPVIRGRAMALGGAFKPTPPPPPIIFD